MSDDDGVFSQFINRSEEIDGIDFGLVNTDNPVNWLGLAKTAVLAVIATIFTGLSAIPQGIASAYSEAWGSLADWVAGTTTLGSDRLLRLRAGLEPESRNLIDATIGQATELVWSLWDFSLAEYGIFAFPIGVSVVLVTLWIAQYGVDYVRGRFL